MGRILAALVLCCWAASVANATVWISIPDVSELQYQTSGDGRVYFRNLNQFNSNALACCYNYWIDTTTPEGKNVFALILAYGAQGRGLLLGLPDNYAAGLVSGVGQW